MRVSVVLCTYNRAAQLERALQSIAQQCFSPFDFEIVVVDNGSTDETAETVRRFAALHPRLAVVSLKEPSIGLSRARNTGILAATGEIVAFMDDDCLASPDWLSSIADAFQTVTPRPQVVGGRVLPIFPPAKPDWFDDLYETDSWGEHPRFLEAGESFSGNNMAFLRETLLLHGGFDERLGMRGTSLRSGEDTAFIARLSHGAPSANALYYQPAAIMHHRIAEHRLRPGYRLKRAFAEGQALYHPGIPYWRRLVYLPWAVLRLFAAIVLSIVHAPRYSRWQPFVAERIVRVARETGKVLGCLGLQVPLRERPPH